MARIRPRLTFANVVSLVALFVALGGGAYAISIAKKNSVTSKSIKNGQVKTKDLGNNAVISSKVKNGSLLGQDFASGQLPRGATGPQGPVGATGPSTGPAGGDLTGSYPNPSIAGGAVDSNKIANHSIISGDLSPALVSELTDSCPSGMTMLGNHVTCMDTTARNVGNANWTAALNLCTTAGLQLPTINEVALGVSDGILSGTVEFWTGTAYNTAAAVPVPPASNPVDVAVAVKGSTPDVRATTDLVPFTICVTAPSEAD